MSCPENLVWGYGFHMHCVRKGTHKRHLAEFSDKVIEWWGEVGHTKYLERGK